MIIDAREIDTGQILSADLCIVGAGAAGISIALQFTESPQAVLVLDSGGLVPDPAIQALNAGHVADPALHPPLARFRRRGLGGATSIWGGRCVPLDAIDFAQRPWVPDSGWPFGPNALLPFYPAANRLCEAGAFAYTADAAFPAGLPPLIAGFRAVHFTDARLERFSCPTDFGARYRARLAASRTLRLILNATVTVLRTGANGALVESLVARTLTGRHFFVRPRLLVLAMGGLETPRLLLASRGAQRNGIGNGADLVGRFYMCHIAGTAGRLRLPGGHGRVWHGYAVAADGTYCRRRLALTEGAQRAFGTGNLVMRLHHPPVADPGHGTGALSALYLARRLVSYEYGVRLHGAPPGPAWLAGLRHGGNILADPLGTGGFLLHWLRHHTLAARKLPSVVIPARSGCYSLDFHAEQAPNRDSRITLAADQDRLGQPKLLVDWRPSGIDLHSVRTSLRLLRQDLADAACGTLDCGPEEADAAALRHGAYGGHHIGTARMANSPLQGVVDANGRVHGMGNLFIAGSAVFPTSGQANPTLTIVALALRLAAHLGRQLRTPPT